ncbi:MAG: efflux RND transporter permease subunit [Proteobacteria bacterium]|nr:efflux RND transporter permease subunit [Pseudomonadota bacterium]
MKLSEVCIRRPVFAWVLTLLITVVGLVGFTKLPLQQYPTIKEPAVTIETNWPGVGPEIMESQITRQIEEVIAGIEGLDVVQSSSKDGKSEVSLNFRSDVNMDIAMNEVRDRIARVHQGGSWPREVNAPTLRKSRQEERPVVTIALVSETTPLEDLYDYAENELKKRFESVPNVSNVEISGSGLYIMRIYVDPKKLASFGITPDKVLDAIRRQNFERPIGKLKSFDREYSVTAMSNLEKPEEFDQIIVHSKGDTLIRLKDVGYAKLETNNKDSRTTLNGKPGIRIAIFKQATANPIEISRGVKEEMKTILEQLKKDRTMFISSDQSEFIERSINEVYRTIFESVVLVIFVVFFFLKSFRASVIPLVTIPVSLIGTFAVMWLFGFTINMLTLMAMVLAIGLVVDDAIVVLENIYRYIEDGMKPFKASFIGIREISGPVIAMTITLAAVYAPVSFASGRIGKFLGEFALTLAVSVIISGFAALTLTPMMCSRLLKHQEAIAPDDMRIASRIKRALPAEKWLSFIDSSYDHYLKVALDNRLKTISIGVGLALFGLFQWQFLPKMQSPKEDTGYVFIKGHAPYTATIDYTEKYVKQLDAFIAQIPEVERRSTNITNATQFDAFVTLKKDRSRTSEEVKRELERQQELNPGVYFEQFSDGSDSTAGSTNIQLALRTTRDMTALKDLMRLATSSIQDEAFIASGPMGKKIQGTPLIGRMDYAVKINREKAISLKIDPLAIAETVETFVRGKLANKFTKNNRRYDVWVEVEEQDKRKKEDILKLLMRTGPSQTAKDGVLLPLAELIEMEPTIGLPNIDRYNRQRAAYMFLELNSGTDVSYAIDRVKANFAESFDEDSSYEFIGNTRTFIKEKSVIALIFGLALIFIYLVLSAQFESWKDPFIIMLSVPLSLAGAVITLAIIKDGSANMYSQIGFITLIGLITKHGILMVQFANELQAKGLKIKEAIHKACHVRLRPILMTTAAMVLGAFPLALATGPGSEIRRQIGWVIVGGMSVGTLFTLFVLPAIYTYIGFYKPKKGLIQSFED